VKVQGLLADKIATKMAAEQASGKRSHWRDCEAIADDFLKKRDMAKAQEWAMKTYEAAVGSEEARAEFNVRTACRLCEVLGRAGLLGKDKGFSSYAVALARLACAENLTDPNCNYPFRYRQMAFPLGTAECRQILQAELTDAEGNPRQSVAEILTWSYSQADQLGEWHAFLEGRISQTEGSLDTRARWLMARACADQVVPGEWEPKPQQGKQWIDKAIATAESPSVRLEALKALVEGYSAAGRHDQGLAVLDSLSEQFSGTAAATEYESLRYDLIKAKAKHIASRVQSKVVQAETRRTTHKQELIRRLSLARSRNDVKQIQQLERALSYLE
jgi:hypothetical protein